MLPEQPMPPRPEDVAHSNELAARNLALHFPHPIRAIGHFIDECSAAAGNMAPGQPVHRPVEVPAPDLTVLEIRENQLIRLEALQAKARNPLSTAVMRKLVTIQRARTFRAHTSASERAVMHQTQLGD
jgi:hypothetical protein